MLQPGKSVSNFQQYRRGCDEWGPAAFQFDRQGQSLRMEFVGSGGEGYA